MLLNKKKMSAMLIVALIISSIFVTTIGTIAAGWEPIGEPIEINITENFPPEIVNMNYKNPRWLWTGDVYSIRVRITDRNGLWDINTTDITLRVNNVINPATVTKESGTSNETEGIFRLDFHVPTITILNGRNIPFNVSVSDGMNSSSIGYISPTFFNPVSTFSAVRHPNFQITDNATQTNNTITITTTNTATDLPMCIDVRADNPVMIGNPNISINVRNIIVTNLTKHSGREFILSNSFGRIDTLRGSDSTIFTFNLRDPHVPVGRYKGRIFFRMTYDIN